MAVRERVGWDHHHRKAKMSEYISRLGWALFMSDHWYNTWLDYKGSIHPNMRGFALMCKTKALINFDRVICS